MTEKIELIPNGYAQWALMGWTAGACYSMTSAGSLLNSIHNLGGWTLVYIGVLFFIKYIREGERDDPLKKIDRRLSVIEETIIKKKP